MLMISASGYSGRLQFSISLDFVTQYLFPSAILMNMYL